jgi:hypothetical protein
MKDAKNIDSHAIIISIKNISCEFVMCTIIIRLQRPFNFYLKKFGRRVLVLALVLALVV